MRTTGWTWIYVMVALAAAQAGCGGDRGPAANGGGSSSSSTTGSDGGGGMGTGGVGTGGSTGTQMGCLSDGATTCYFDADCCSGKCYVAGLGPEYGTCTTDPSKDGTCLHGGADYGSDLSYCCAHAASASDPSVCASLCAPMPNCYPIGAGPCFGDTDCCSLTCVDLGTSSAHCGPAAPCKLDGACRSPGLSCRSDTDCCSGSCDSPGTPQSQCNF